MIPEKWERAKSIFGDALDVEPAERHALVRDACSGDAELFEEVMSLLSADAGRTVLRNPIFSHGAPRLAESDPDAAGTAPPREAAADGTEDVPPRFDPDVEREYAAEYFRLSLPRVRGALLLGVVLYSGFAVLDRWVAPEQYRMLWLIRAVIVGATAAGYAYSYAPRFMQSWQWIVTLLVALGALGILVMIATIPAPGSHLYYAGLLLLTIYYCTLIRLGFVPAMSLSIGIFVLYVALAVLTRTPVVVVATNVMMLSAGNVIALLANYALERHSRRDFWQRRVIESRTRELEEKNERLHLANAELLRSREEALRAAERNDLLFAALTEALPGTVLDDKYRLDEKIGAGGFGTVYKGFHLLLQRPVAVKLLRPSGEDASSNVAKFRREAIAAGLLEHPNAVHVFDFGVAAGSVAYLVMELLEGQSLAQALEARGAFDLRRCCEIVAPLCSVLAHAHQRGLIHCDLKPSNVFLHDGSDGEVVKIIDFGVARLLASPAVELPAVTTVVMGTPGYMAPERLAGGDFDSPADVYSLGVVVYEMLAGEKPFASGNWAATATQVTQTAPALCARNPQIPAAVGAVVDRALARDARTRPSAEELGRVLLDAAASTRSAV